MWKEIGKLPSFVKFMLAILAGIGAPFGTYTAIDESGLRWWAERDEVQVLEREFRTYATQNDRHQRWVDLEIKQNKLRLVRGNLYQQLAEKKKLSLQRLPIPRELQQRIDFYEDEERRLKREVDDLKTSLNGG